MNIYKMRKLLVIPTFVLALSGYSYGDSTLSKKFTLDTELNGKINVDYKQTVYDNGSMSRDSRYTRSGKLLSEIHEEFDSSGIIQSEVLKDYVCGREDSIRRDGMKIVGTYRNGWGDKLENYVDEVPPGVTFGSGIFNSINNSLDILKSGGKVDLKFYVPEKTDWFTLRLVGWDDVEFNGIPARKVTIEPVSFFLKLFVKNSYYIVDPVTRNPLAFSGTFSPVSKDCKPMVGVFRFSPLKKKA